jgi:hypothetical protein
MTSKKNSKRALPGNVVRALRLADAARRAMEVETAFALGRGTAGSEAAKREIADAAFDYLVHHWDGYVPSDAPASVVEASRVVLDAKERRRSA